MLRTTGARVAVLVVDPSSPFSGGAILGDRVRMSGHDTDPDVYVRSMATRGHLGGLARSTPQAVRVLEAAGFDWVLVEATVGVGQVEVEIAGAADTTVVVLNPGLGDGVQAAKAGLMEIADVFVVNKADRERFGGHPPRRRAMLSLAAGRGWEPPVVETVATAGEAPTTCCRRSCSTGPTLKPRGSWPPGGRNGSPTNSGRPVVEAAVTRAVPVRDGPRFATVIAQVADGDLDLYTAATRLQEELLPEGADRGGTG